MHNRDCRVKGRQVELCEWPLKQLEFLKRKKIITPNWILCGGGYGELLHTSVKQIAGLVGKAP